MKKDAKTVRSEAFISRGAGSRSSKPPFPKGDGG